MQNYIEEAHQTSAPVKEARKRLLEDTDGSLKLTACIACLLSSISAHANYLDKVKKVAFGGKVVPLLAFPPSLSAESISSFAHAMMDENMVELLHGVVGLGTEIGELMEHLVEVLFKGKELDVVNVNEELGDLMWYMAKIMRVTGTTFEEVQQKNLAKLKARHGAKFNVAAADEEGRDRAAEREILGRSIPMKPMKPEDYDFSKEACMARLSSQPEQEK